MGRDTKGLRRRSDTGLHTTAFSLGTPIQLHPRIAHVFDRFLARPVLTHKQAARQNQAACPLDQASAQVNADQLQNDHEKWLAVDPGTIDRMRRGALSYLEQHTASEGEAALIGPGLALDGTPVRQGSRGIVFAAGNHRTVDRAIGCIKEIQKLGWHRGDIEVFHFEGELTDEGQRQRLRDLGATPHAVSTKKAPGRWKNFELKAEAILRSSFDEVLYLDSDNYPLSHVGALFDSPLFRDVRGGNVVFWPDLNRDHPDNAIHRLLGIPCDNAWELDSGQILISKSGNDGLNLAALYLAQYMAEEGDFWFSGGDKDTFRYAFLALSLTYTPAPRWLSLLGNRDPRDNFCGAAMLQYGLDPPRDGYADPADPEPLFVHANLLKHMSGVRPGDVFPLFRRLFPRQDDVRTDYHPATALHSVTGGGNSVAGRGLCSNIIAFRGGADIETVDTKTLFGGMMKDFEEHFFSYGASPGLWR
ncbi:mannosyltransferase putative-domain-containing protein [Diaporthe sp. PMI_573]|nr:mannosyltransferase putative-domain-containing protein [Diaporthaceae sp. PMI_573]